MQRRLTPDDREILDCLAALPDLSPRSTGPVLHARFGELTRVWQHVNALIDTEAALTYQPDLVARLRRLRTGRRGHLRRTAA
ncbi:DUF3263 domain-containing protein [Kineococcus radiotolerans]|uniref:DUF3263 domain-containing protein n=1 Tax=Kineococcus radiotolerans (strain ATCC BAA-149 / DSM 14245 / SRS30216) TaxID=266940 RepID=A6W8S5_KINRD|nr:DUF3263 domain-containing protein [Kineococcus radiotolerans]ABS03214.1 hypothetical protein Krad_1728 [Kineococcus radiotolerans SRS30216 = ATCC BAA-149]